MALARHRELAPGAPDLSSCVALTAPPALSPQGRGRGWGSSPRAPCLSPTRPLCVPSVRAGAPAGGSCGRGHGATLPFLQ